MRRTIPVLLCLFLTACVDISVSTKLQPDGSGIQKWRFSSTAVLASKVRNQVMQLFQGKEVKCTDQFQQGDFVLQCEMSFHDVKQLQDRFHRTELTRSGFWVRHFRYSETWQALPKENPFHVEVSVETPGRIGETNADRKEGRVAYWKFQTGDIAGSKSLTVNYSRLNYPPIIAVVVLFLLGFGAVAIAILRARVVCPSCGTSTFGHSAFCKSCGKSMTSETTTSG